MHCIMSVYKEFGRNSNIMILHEVAERLLLVILLYKNSP